MLRRQFIRQGGVIAIGIGVMGNIRWNNGRFTGTSATSTDILGPFYRPGAPFRTNLNPPGFKGHLLHLQGNIFKEDGRTPARNCLIEIWQCKPDGLYDNVSDEFEYRASLRTGRDGKYQFLTTIPIPYPNDENPSVFRPAHIHMRISVPGQQDLITQVYLKNDPYLYSDPSTQSTLSINRILSMKKINDKESRLVFDIVLQKEYLPAESLFHQISGTYRMSDRSLFEFYKDGDFLFWKWNGQIWGGLAYHGANTFKGGVDDTEARFEVLPGGNAKVFFRLARRRSLLLEGTKLVRYNNPG